MSNPLELTAHVMYHIRMTKSKELAKIFLEFAYWHQINNEPFKPRAYELAGEAIEALGDEVDETWRKGGIKALKELPGIGQSIAEKIDEYFSTGKITEYDRIKKRFPVDIWSLAQVQGLGAKHIGQLYQALKIKNLKDLKNAISRDKLAGLPRWGQKSQAKIAKQIELMEHESGRQLLGYVLPIADSLVERLAQVPGVKRCTYAGSLRRKQETVGDIDLLATSSKPETIMDAFTAMPEVESVHEKGKTRSSVRLKNGLDADLRVAPDKVYGAALQYFTGDKRHNVLLRELALKKGFSLNEYGLFRLKIKDKRLKTKSGRRSTVGTRDVGRELITCTTEEAIYKKLGLNTPPPEIRVGDQEIAAAAKHQLPKLMPYGSVKGDLQVQTEWTDGSASIEDMAKEAKKLGLEYLAVTDHTQALAFIHGLDEKRLAEQGCEIDRLNKKLKDFRILKGTECDILKDGSLDLTAAARQKLDWVGISIHSHFNLSRAEQTKRLIRAMSQPYVDCLFHPTCRLIGRREAIDFDLEEILTAAKKYNIILEINAFPDRSDLRDLHVRLAVQAGVKLAINTDAHAPEHLAFLPLGEAIARRGWAAKADIINTKNIKQLMTWLAKKNKL